MTTFLYEMSMKHINIPKVLQFSWMKKQKLDETRKLLKLQRLKPFLEMTDNVYPDLIKVFYTNLSLDGTNLVSIVKGVKILITSSMWSNITRLKHNRFKVGKDNTSEISEFNKMQFYRSFLRDQNTSFNRFHVDNINLTSIFLAYITG